MKLVHIILPSPSHMMSLAPGIDVMYPKRVDWHI